MAGFIVPGVMGWRGGSAEVGSDGAVPQTLPSRYHQPLAAVPPSTPSALADPNEATIPCYQVGDYQ